MKLRHYQTDAVQSTIEYIKECPAGNPLIVLPTGSGKSLVLAEIARRCKSRWNYKVLILSHVKEILEQNHGTIKNHVSHDVGLYSAGLKSKTISDITVAGIQSAYREPDLFKQFDIVIVDEAHRLSVQNDTMYKKFLDAIGNPPCIGLTATPFRLGSGYIYGEEQLFDKVVCNWCTEDKFKQLVSEGFLSPLIAESTSMSMDVSDIKLKGGEYNDKELSTKFDREDVTNIAIKEILAAGHDRKKWMLFAIDIDHAEHIAETLIMNGIRTVVVHSKMGEYGLNRDKIIQEYKNGSYRAIVNVNILTTGFDDPGIDLIVPLRPTNSTALHIQLLGRGSRVAAGKSDCLVLDFAGNTARLGPINCPVVKTPGKGLAGGEPIMKTCPECKLLVFPAVRICERCKFEFPFEHHLNSQSSADVIISDDRPRWIYVDKTEYHLNTNFGSPSTVRVTYTCGKIKINEWICVEHRGFAKHKADHWIEFRGGVECKTAAELMEISDSLYTPVKINVMKKNKYYVISNSSFKEID